MPMMIHFKNNGWVIVSLVVNLCNPVQFWTTNVSVLEEIARWQTSIFKASSRHHLIPVEECWLPRFEWILPQCLQPNRQALMEKADWKAIHFLVGLVVLTQTMQIEVHIYIYQHSLQNAVIMDSYTHTWTFIDIHRYILTQYCFLSEICAHEPKFFRHVLFF